MATKREITATKQAGYTVRKIRPDRWHWRRVAGGTICSSTGLFPSAQAAWSAAIDDVKVRLAQFRVD